MKKDIIGFYGSFVSGVMDFDVVGATLGTVILGVLQYFLGSFDQALNIFIFSLCIDYLTGWIKAALTRNLYSGAGYRGILKKGGMIAMVSLAYQLDKTAGTTFIRNIFISGYVGNELTSIAENAEAIGLLPRPLGKFLKQYQEKFSKMTYCKGGLDE